MKKWQWLCAFLLVFLVGTNVFWMHSFLYKATSTKATDQQVYELEQTNKQLQAMLPELTNELTQAQVTAIAAQYSDLEAYEKDGCTWVGFVGLNFDGSGRLQEVVNTWSSDEPNPCFK